MTVSLVSLHSPKQQAQIVTSISVEYIVCVGVCGLFSSVFEVLFLDI